MFFYRAKIYLFEEFLINWHERLRKIEEHSVMTVKLQSEVDRYKVRLLSLFRCSVYVSRKAGLCFVMF
jgi:hypothetical protein